MTEEHAAIESGRYARTFDYFKHVTMVSLISIGGVLGLLQGDGPTLKPAAIILVITMLAAAAFLATLAMLFLSRAAMNAVPDSRKLRLGIGALQTVSTMAVMFGLGVFLGAFVGAIT